MEAFEAFESLTDPYRFPGWAHDALRNVDALFQGEGVPLPSTSILDYIYGIAAYKAWRSKHDDAGLDRMKDYRDRHYVRTLPAPRDGDDDSDDTPGPDDPINEFDDPNDFDYKPPKSYTSGLEETMDELNMVLMYINGITPEMADERRQKKIEQEERAAQEVGRSKVTEWRLDVC